MPQTTLHLPAMSCAHCQGVIEKAVAGVPGHRVTSFDPVQRLIHVTADRDVRHEDLRRVLEEAGYPAEHPAAEATSRLMADDASVDQVLGSPSALAASGDPAELYGGPQPADLPESARPADQYGGEEPAPLAPEATPAALYGGETPAADWTGAPAEDSSGWARPEDEAA